VTEQRQEVYFEDMQRRRQAHLAVAKPRPKGVLPHLPSDPDALVLWLTAAFRPSKGFEFERFDRTSIRKQDPVSITFRNGRERRSLRFERGQDLTGNALRGNVVGMSAGFCQMPHLSPGEIEDVWVGLCTIAKVMTEYDDREETIKWLHQMLDESKPLTGKTLASDGRHDALMALRSQGEFVRRDAEQLVRGVEGWQRRPVRFVDDQTADQFLRAGETATFLWHVVGVRDLTRPGLRARLAEVGVEGHRFEAYQPPHPKLMLFQLTGELVEYADATSPIPAQTALPGAGAGTNERGQRMAF
jgi:hypothetical protein